MSNFNFKEGDKVYYPDISNEILILEKTTNPSHPFKVTLEHGVTRSFTTDGRRLYFNEKPSIFPATQEWYDKLVHVYPDLEKPPKRKEPIDIILAMINDWHYIPCRVGDHKDEIDYTDLINAIAYSDTPSFIGSSEWKYAEPFDPHTGKGIIDYVDGEIVLED